jgi:hypothetical protein
MAGNTLIDFCADPAAIHTNGEIAITADPQGGLRILVGQPAQPPGGADRGVPGGDLEGFALRKQLPTSLPHGLESVDQVQYRAVAFD